jgi:dTMP kinase
MSDSEVRPPPEAAVEGTVFLVFEGADGAGKSSQLSRLAERLEGLGYTVSRLLEPTHGPLGSEIRRRAAHGPPLAAREELDLFLRDRRENVEGNVLPALARGEVVLQDRYFYSTAAYQGARPALGLTPAEIVTLHDWAPRPDLVILLDLEVEEGLRRVRARGPSDAFEELSMQERVRSNFLELARTDATFHKVDASAAPELVAQAIWVRVEPLVASPG